MSGKVVSPAPDRTPFWHFSGAVYASRGVAEACISLQDRHRLDVNLLLFCAWAGSKGRRLDGGDIGQLRSVVWPWQDNVVTPLRRARRWLKRQSALPDGLAEAFREEVKTLELQAEMLEQLMLYQELAIGEGEGSPEDVAANLLLYVTRFKPLPTDTDLANLCTLLCAVCPEVTPVHAIRILED